MANLYKLTRYLIVGGAVFVLQFTALAVLVERFALEPLFASIIAYFIALVSSFLLQRSITFRKHDSANVGREFLATTLLALFSFGFNTIAMHLLLIVGVYYLTAQIVVTAAIVIYSYFAYQYIFRT